MTVEPTQASKHVEISSIPSFEPPRSRDGISGECTFRPCKRDQNGLRLLQLDEALFDALSFSFTPSDLAGEWYEYFCCEKGYIRSKTDEIELSKDGKEIEKCTLPKFRINFAESWLCKANDILHARKRVLHLGAKKIFEEGNLSIASLIKELKDPNKSGKALELVEAIGRNILNLESVEPNSRVGLTFKESVETNLKELESITPPEPKGWGEWLLDGLYSVCARIKNTFLWLLCLGKK